MASMVYGQQPDRVAALADMGATGVDEQTTMAFRYNSGAMAALTCAVRTNTPGAVTIHGTQEISASRLHFTTPIPQH